MTSQRCHECDDPAVRNIGAWPYCAHHAEALLAPLRARHQPDDEGIGHGRDTGPAPADWGPGWVTLTCDRCTAEWVGQDGDPCEWCRRRHARMLEDQRCMLARPQLPDKADARYDVAFNSWVKRLARGVVSGLVDETEAAGWIGREQRRDRPVDHVDE